MKIKREYILTLSEEEAFALHTLVGNLNDEEFAKAGITRKDREFISKLFDGLCKGE